MGADVNPLNSSLKKTKSMIGELRSSLSGMVSVAGGIGISSAVSSGVGFIKDMGVGMVQLAADAETTRIQFEVLTGSMEQGAKLFNDIEKFAGRTSFDLQSAGDAAKQMLAAGVGEKDIMGTMQLLGDLAMGDANNLGYLSKAYTDVLNKGKLQGQELRQFAENGVGLAAALSKTMGVSTAEILKMSEDGKISFMDMQKALIALTGEGGRFNGMMARINETFSGQWASLVENVQSFGRDLGSLVLPMLKNIVSEVNLLVQGFRESTDKGKVIGDLFEAGMDVAILTIADKWDKMLEKMAKGAVDTFSTLSKGLASGNLGGIMSGVMQATGQRRGGTPSGELDRAKTRFSGLIDNLKAQAPPPQAPTPLIDPKIDIKAQAATKLSDSLKGIFEKVSPIASNAMLAGQSKLTDLGIKGNYLGSIVKSMFTNDKARIDAPERSTAANKGSREALMIAMRGSKNTFETKSLKMQEKVIEIAQKQLMAIKDAAPQLVAEF